MGQQKWHGSKIVERWYVRNLELVVAKDKKLDQKFGNVTNVADQTHLCIIECTENLEKVSGSDETNWQLEQEKTEETKPEEVSEQSSFAFEQLGEELEELVQLQLNEIQYKNGLLAEQLDERQM